MTKRSYDSTVARIAGNIAAGLVVLDDAEPARVIQRDAIATAAVDLARRIVARVEATEPPRSDQDKADELGAAMRGKLGL